MQILIVAFVTSLLITFLLIRYAHVHMRFSGDTQLDGKQKFHSHPVPRIGGLGIMAALLSALVFLFFQRDSAHWQAYGLVVLASLPAFLGGLVEDVTKRIGVVQRLLLTGLSALFGYWLLGGLLVRLDFPVLDGLLVWTPFALILTVIAVAGIANAINIIDGFNGLAPMVCVLILSGLGYVGYLVGDALIWNVALVLAGGCLGFMVWNWPLGLIFLGDGGAYLLGFMVGELSVLLVMRHPEVSAWFPLLLVVYPVCETLFSIYRKKWIRGISPGVPDGIHLHMLIHKRLIRFLVGSAHSDVRLVRNSLTSPYLWLLCSAGVFPAVIFWNNSILLQLFCVVFVLAYVWIYRVLVRFKTPWWLRLGGRRPINR